MTLASTWTASASVVNLGEGRGQRQTVTQLASSKNYYLLHVMITSPLLLFWLPSLVSIFSPAFGFLCHSPEI